MPIFAYKAKKGPREIIEGTVEAESREGAIVKIDRMGYVPVQVGLREGFLRAAPITHRHLGFFSRVRSGDLTIFTDQLATLVKSKVPLFEAINILSTQTENPLLKKIISYISEELKNGRTLSESMSKYPKVFPPLYISMVHSGESGGVLEGTLSRLAQFREEEEEIKAKISSALAYPIFIIFVGLVTIFLLLTFGIPRLVSLFSEAGQELPLPTQILISISQGIRNYWFWVLIVIIFSVFILRRKQVMKKEKIIFDRLKLRLPVLGNLAKKAMLAGFSRTFATLLANSIPVFQALEIIIPTLNNEIFKRELEKVHADIIAGSSFAQSMKKSNWFPSFMINMITVAEKGGNLQEVLLEVANFYEREVNKLVKIMTSLLEPTIILVMGLMVGFIVMAMLLPIFEINIGMR